MFKKSKSANKNKKKELDKKLNELADKNEKNMNKTESEIREEKLKELNSKLLAARTTYETSPDLLKTAEKDYYVLKDGEDAYNQRELLKYHKEANELKTAMMDKHENEMKNSLQSLSYYDSQRTYITNVNIIKLSILTNIRNKLNEIRIEQSEKNTNDRKTFYILQEQESLDMWLRIVNHVILSFVIVFIIYNAFEAEKENINIFTYAIVIGLVLIVFYLELFIKWIKTIPLSINVYASWGEEKNQSFLFWSIIIVSFFLFGVIQYTNK
jgi:hypothetical protein